MVAKNGSKQDSRRLVDLKIARKEAAVRQQYRERVIHEQERRRLARVSQIDHEELIERLVDAGFTSESIAALTLLPVAAAAGGSGYVTNEEEQTAAQAIFSFNVSEQDESEALFQRWLVHRPSDELMILWEEYTRERLRSATRREREGRGRHLLGLARSVALASGGFAGIGQICAGERAVLDTIRRVYQLTD